MDLAGDLPPRSPRGRASSTDSSIGTSGASPPLFHDAVQSFSEGIPGQALPPYIEDDAASAAEASQSQAASRQAAPWESFFDVAPRSDSTSFQIGYLGLKGFRSWVKGDVLVKLDEQTRSRGGYSQCFVELKAIERASRPSRSRNAARPSAVAGSSSAAANEVDYEEEVELFSAREVLWDASAATSSTAPGLVLPSTMPFSFTLTPDLPHCIHSKRSSLTYHIEARLVSSRPDDFPDAVKMVPVHLTRYTRPGPLNQHALREVDGAELQREDFSLGPQRWLVHSPTTAYVELNKTIFRRAEPIDVKVRIPPPSQESVSDKGLKLRAVEADLVRIISVKEPPPADDEQARSGQQSSFPSAAEEKAALRRAYGEEDTSGPSADASGSPGPLEPEVQTHEALLAHSGKLCRFHSQRPVLLRLTLHPPFDRANMPHPHPDHDALASGPVFGRGGGGGCESISQETVMHVVSFEVRIRVAIHGGQGERRDISCKRTIHILPGAAGLLQGDEGESAADGDVNGPSASTQQQAPRSEKQAEKARLYDDETQTSTTDAYAAGLMDFGMDDEYDGYEDVGRSLDELIDETNGVDAPGSSSSHEERLEQLRQLLERSDEASSREPPPTLLESQHDLQVEVEVEGVGLAMPRHRHPADTLPDGSLIPDAVAPMLGPAMGSGSVQPHFVDVRRPTYHESSLEEPPPPLSPSEAAAGQLDDDVDRRIDQLRAMSLGRSGPLRAFAGDDGAAQSIPSSGRSSPPPPHSPPRPAYTSLDPGPSYESVVANDRDASRSASAGSSLHNHVEPPPYIDSGVRRTDGATRPVAPLDDATGPGQPRLPGVVHIQPVSAAFLPHPPASEGSTQDELARPPAYGAYSSSSVHGLAGGDQTTRHDTRSRPLPYSRASQGGGPPGYED